MREYKICSNLSRFNSELDFLKRYFGKNKFSRALVNSIIWKFFDVSSSPDNSVLTADKPLFCINPFISFRANFQIKKCVREIIRADYPHLKVKLVFVISTKVVSLFKF